MKIIKDLYIIWKLAGIINRAGILKYATSAYNSSNISVIEDNEVNPKAQINTPTQRVLFQSSEKKQLRVIDQKTGLQTLNHNSSDILPKISTKSDRPLVQSLFVPK